MNYVQLFSGWMDIKKFWYIQGGPRQNVFEMHQKVSILWRLKKSN